MYFDRETATPTRRRCAPIQRAFGPLDNREGQSVGRPDLRGAGAPQPRGPVRPPPGTRQRGPGFTVGKPVERVSAAEVAGSADACSRHPVGAPD